MNFGWIVRLWGKIKDLIGKGRAERSTLLQYIDPCYYLAPDSSHVYFALLSGNGKFISFDPATDQYTEVNSISEFKIWDYQTFSGEQEWFMGNNARPQIDYSIRRIPPSEVEKLPKDDKPYSARL